MKADAGVETALGFPTAAEHPRQRGLVEVWTLEQDLVLACIRTQVKVTQQPILPRQWLQRKFPVEVLNAVLNMDTGELMEMRQLLQNPKYSELWGKFYTKELGELSQGIPGTA